MQFNLLRIHYELRQLEQFRAKAHDCAKKPDTTADARMTLNALFKDLNALSNGFDNLVWRVARSAFDIVRRRHGQLLVQLAKIVDTEETRDADIKARRRASGRDRDSQTSTVDRLEGRSPAAGVQQLRPRRVVGVVVRDINDDDADDPDNQTRGYKERLLDVFRSVVTRRTQELFAETERLEHDSGEPGTGLSQMTDMVVEELSMVFQAVAPCFPPQWKMRDFFLREYHLAVHRYIGELAANRDVLDGATLLSLLRWSREYHSAMRRTLGVPDSLLEPRILDGREDQLVGEYLGLVRDKLTQWLTNLMNEETSNFRDRTKDVDREGERYYLGIAVQ
ncbi:Sec6-domain-containing protein, partial [Ramicandelaber brevisporus]